MKFESILSEINGFGKFQIMIVLIQCVSRITLPAHFLLNIFIAAMPSHHCAIDDWFKEDVPRNLTLAQKLIVSIPAEADGTPSCCVMYSEPQFNLLFNSSNTTDLRTKPCQNGWAFDNSTFKSTLVTEVQNNNHVIFVSIVSFSVFVSCTKWHNLPSIFLSVGSGMQEQGDEQSHRHHLFHRRHDWSPSLWCPQ